MQIKPKKDWIEEMLTDPKGELVQFLRILLGLEQTQTPITKRKIKASDLFASGSSSTKTLDDDDDDNHDIERLIPLFLFPFLVGFAPRVAPVPGDITTKLMQIGWITEEERPRWFPMDDKAHDAYVKARERDSGLRKLVITNWEGEKWEEILGRKPWETAKDKDVKDEDAQAEAGEDDADAEDAQTKDAIPGNAENDDDTESVATEAPTEMDVDTEEPEIQQEAQPRYPPPPTAKERETLRASMLGGYVVPVRDLYNNVNFGSRRHERNTDGDAVPEEAVQPSEVEAGVDEEEDYEAALRAAKVGKAREISPTPNSRKRSSDHEQVDGLETKKRRLDSSAASGSNSAEQGPSSSTSTQVLDDSDAETEAPTRPPTPIDARPVAQQAQPAVNRYTRAAAMERSMEEGMQRGHPGPGVGPPRRGLARTETMVGFW